MDTSQPTHTSTAREPVVASRLKRERSIASVSSDGDDLSAEPRNISRKRFSDHQVNALEDLYRSSTHPPRAEREKLAAELELEKKQVTIWFQNRRQADRKAGVLPSDPPSTPGHDSPPAGPPPSPFPKTPRRLLAPSMPSPFAGALNPFAPGPMALSKSYAKQAKRNPVPLPGSAPVSIPSKAHRLTKVHSLPATRISLDELADRTRSPRRPTFAASSTDMTGGPDGDAWDDLPLSLLGDSPHKVEEDVLAFGRPGTLEWACAQARVGHQRRGSDDAETFAMNAKRKRSASGQMVASLSGRKKAKSFSAGSPDGPVDTSRASSRASETSPSLPPKRSTLDATADSAATKAKLDEGEVRLGEETEEEDEHEAITPGGSLNSDTFWSAPRDTARPPPVHPARAGSKGKKPERKPASAVAQPDDELMSAALVLCGLGRRA